MAAMDPSVTHLVKVDDDSYVHMARLLIKVKKMPREKLFLGYMEKAGVCCAVATNLPSLTRCAVTMDSTHIGAHNHRLCVPTFKCCK